jgi:hypothetical protein
MVGFPSQMVCNRLEAYPEAAESALITEGIVLKIC